MRMFILLFVVLPLFAGEAEFLKAVRERDVATVKSMLDADPALVNAKTESGNSATIVALFALKKGEEAFPDPKANPTLDAIVAHKPKFGLDETAALGTSEQLAQLLADDPGAVKRANRVGWTLLHIAAYAGNVETAKLLIARGADVNVRAKSKFKNTPLQAAMLTSQYDTAKLLLDNGADVLVRQAEGFSALHEAAGAGRDDIVKLLIEHGAEVGARANNGETPLDEAVRGKHEGTAEILRKKGS